MPSGLPSSTTRTSASGTAARTRAGRPRCSPPPGRSGSRRGCALSDLFCRGEPSSLARPYDYGCPSHRACLVADRRWCRVRPFRRRLLGCWRSSRSSWGALRRADRLLGHGPPVHVGLRRRPGRPRRLIGRCSRPAGSPSSPCSSCGPWPSGAPSSTVRSEGNTGRNPTVLPSERTDRGDRVGEAGIVDVEVGHRRTSRRRPAGAPRARPSRPRAPWCRTRWSASRSTVWPRTHRRGISRRSAGRRRIRRRATHRRPR